MVQEPLAIAPLPVGTWSIQIASREEAYHDQGPGGKKHVIWPEMPRSISVKVTLKDDAAAAALWDQKLLDKVRKDDLFPGISLPTITFRPSSTRC